MLLFYFSFDQFNATMVSIRDSLPNHKNIWMVVEEYFVVLNWQFYCTALKPECFSNNMVATDLHGHLKKKMLLLYCPTSMSSVCIRQFMRYSSHYTFSFFLYLFTHWRWWVISIRDFFVLWLELGCILYIQHWLALQGQPWIHKRSPTFYLSIASLQAWSLTRRGNEYLAGSPLCADKSQF